MTRTGSPVYTISLGWSGYLTLVLTPPVSSIFGKKDPAPTFTCPSTPLEGLPTSKPHPYVDLVDLVDLVDPVDLVDDSTEQTRLSTKISGQPVGESLVSF